MIFVTTGTNEQGFDRLVAAARELPGDEELLVQYGSSTELHGRGRWEAFLSWEEMTAAMTQARVVVAHAGVGSILLAHRCGRRPVVMPRRVALGEAVDDHQLELAQRLHARGEVTLALDGDALARAVAVAPSMLAGTGSGPATGPLVAELRCTLQRLTAGVPA
ncbi:glycosyltransferase [Baekduia soli]|uniref:Glycosyltransferase n=1 Tax=Baekduia soli TaxID=496014 RepID=A0A5B8UAN7_9ACTN|nr:glycosyltransferase [Baekduia soli]QEC50087.1 glycosyltransferase [Baekduia soli]